MDCLLTDEQKMVQEMVENFARDKIEPQARRNDAEKRFPVEILKEAGELGLFGIPYPEEVGGAGLDYVSYMLTISGIARYCASTAVIISAHASLVCDTIFKHGTDAQKEKYLPDLLAGRTLGCFCLTEPHAGSDAGAISTAAVKDGDGWVLNGVKQFITNAPYAQVAVVFACSSPELGNKGKTAFIVDMDTPGVIVGKNETKLGIRASAMSEVRFEDCRLPADSLLGEVDRGFKVAMGSLDGGRIGIASQALGIARAAIEDATAYAKQREQFGKPIAEFQGLQWYLAEMATEYEAAWLLTYRAALMRDRGERTTKEAAMAKWKASEVCEMCATRAVQIHGGYGYTTEFNPERYFRDSKITQIYEGTSEVQKSIIAGQILR